nr:hypothetical protein HmN_000326500 [Hymenolepis microstoma]
MINKLTLEISSIIHSEYRDGIMESLCEELEFCYFPYWLDLITVVVYFDHWVYTDGTTAMVTALCRRPPTMRVMIRKFHPRNKEKLRFKGDRERLSFQHDHNA